MEMRIAVKVDVVQALEITQCLHRQDVDAQLSGSRAWLQDRYLPVDWPILLKYHPELQDGAPLRLWVPTCAGDRPQGTPPADCDLTADEVLEIMQALWNWDGPAQVCRLWNLVYAALSWGTAQELADQGACIDLSTIAGRKAFLHLMEKQAQLHGAARLAAQDEEAARAELRATLGARSHGRKHSRRPVVVSDRQAEQSQPEAGPQADEVQRSPASVGTVQEERAGYAAGSVALPQAAVTVTVAGSPVRIVLAGGPAACVVTSYAG